MSFDGWSEAGNSIKFISCLGLLATALSREANGRRAAGRNDKTVAGAFARRRLGRVTRYDRPR
jgi:hypothetical protein